MRLKEYASIRTHVESFPDFERFLLLLNLIYHSFTYLQYSYEDVISKIRNNANSKEKEVQTLWKEEKYEPIVTFLENLQQGAKLNKHDALALAFSSLFKTLTSSFSERVLELEKKVHFQNIENEFKLLTVVTGGETL